MMYTEAEETVRQEIFDYFESQCDVLLLDGQIDDLWGIMRKIWMPIDGVKLNQKQKELVRELVTCNIRANEEPSRDQRNAEQTVCNIQQQLGLVL